MFLESMVAVGHLLWTEGCAIARECARVCKSVQECALGLGDITLQTPKLSPSALLIYHIVIVCFSLMCDCSMCIAHAHPHCASIIVARLRASLLSSGWSTSTVLARPLPPQGTQPIFLGRGTRTANIFSWEPSDCEPQFSEASEISGTQHIGDTTYWWHNISGTQHVGNTTYQGHNISVPQHIGDTTYLFCLFVHHHMGIIRMQIL